MCSKCKGIIPSDLTINQLSVIKKTSLCKCKSICSHLKKRTRRANYTIINETIKSLV